MWFVLLGLRMSLVEIDETSAVIAALEAGGPSDPVAGQLPWSKRVFDVTLSTLLLGVLGCAVVALFVLNPFFIRGPLFFYQRRMGLAGHPFRAVKFRSMRPAGVEARGAFDALEEERISRFGGVMRKCRIDELPQIINVLRGEMSLIGPRPDLYEHACFYQTNVPGYAARHQVMPGISGYAQTEVGYVDGESGVQRKVAADLFYVAHRNFRFDLWIAWRTICVVAGRRGR